jgi:hypothetical protein
MAVDPHINPATGVWDDNYYANNHLDPTVSGNGGGNSNPIDIVALAGSLQQMQIAANQPAIATLGSQQSGLEASYKSLLDSIKGSQTVAQNSQTLTTNNEMAQRGVLPTSTLYGQNMNNALLGVNSAFGGLTANTTAQEQNDLLSLAGQIAGLQAGNVGNAISGASSAYSSNLGLLAAQLAAQTGSYTATAKPYVSLGNGLVMNSVTGQITIPGGASSSSSTSPTTTTTSPTLATKVGAPTPAATPSTSSYNSTVYNNTQPTISGYLPYNAFGVGTNTNFSNVVNSSKQLLNGY